MTDPRLRTATTIEIGLAINKLFSVLPPRTGNEERLEGLLDGYLGALEGVDLAALIETINQVIRGEIAELSRRWCPSPPELSAVVRANMAATRRAIAASTDRVVYQPTPFISMQLRQDAARQRMANEGRRLLHCDVNRDQFEMMARRRELAPGSYFIALLGEIYGPRGPPAAGGDSPAPDKPEFTEPETEGKNDE